MQQQVVRLRVRDSLRARYFTCQLYRFVCIVDIHAMCCQHFHRHKRAAKTLRVHVCVCVCVCVLVCVLDWRGVVCAQGIRVSGLCRVCKQLAVVWWIEWSARRQLPLPTAPPPSLFLDKSPSYDETKDRGFGVKWRAGLTRAGFTRERATRERHERERDSQPCTHACVSARLTLDRHVRVCVSVPVR